MENKNPNTQDTRQIIDQVNRSLEEVRQALEQHSHHSHQIQEAERSQRDSLVRLAQAVAQTQMLAQHIQWIETQKLGGSLGIGGFGGFAPQYGNPFTPPGMGGQYGNPFTPQYGYGFNQNQGGGRRRGRRGGRGRNRDIYREGGGQEFRADEGGERSRGGRRDDEITRAVRQGVERGIEGAVNVLRQGGFVPGQQQPMWQSPGFRA